MSTALSPLHHVLDVAKWQSVQDALAAATSLAIITVDYRGMPVTVHSGCSDFCRQIRAEPRFRPHCLKCDARGGLEAARTNRPYIYFCHCGIVDVAIPIIIDDLYIGAVMAGQVRLSDEESQCLDLERMSNVVDVRQTADMRQMLRKAFDEIPTLTLAQVRQTSEMLFQLCGYIVEQAGEKRHAIEMARTALLDAQNSPNDWPVGGYGGGYGIGPLRRVQRETAGNLIDAFISGTFQNKNARVSPTLQPAIDHIFMHRCERITLQQLASLCHISPSYFSRMFRKEIGENLSGFLIRLRVMFARQLLETTDLSVQAIGEALGFYETGYFIRKFKALTGTTPMEYRRQNRRRPTDDTFTGGSQARKSASDPEAPTSPDGDSPAASDDLP